MGRSHEFLLRFKALFAKRRIDREMAEELEFHQMMLREKLLRQGVPEGSVETAARRAFGNPVRWHERLRELWQFRTLENLLRDVSFSMRLLRRSPGFTMVALLTLALGVGANTAIFSLINGLLLRPLPVPHADELTVLGIQQGGPRTQYSFPAPFFRSLERRHEIFADVFAYSQEPLQVRGNSNNEIVGGQFVSGEFFRGLQTPALLGRTLTPEDDTTGGNPAGLAVVISEHFWRSWFGGVPDVVGRKLQIDNTMFTIAGVMPKSFIGANPTQQPEIFVPLAAEQIVQGEHSMIAAGYHGWWFETMRIPLLDGREFRWNDTTPTGLKVILNQAAAKLFFPDQNPIGHNVEHEKNSYEVVGVVGDAKYEDLRSPAPATIYVPITQNDQGKPSYTVVARVDGAAAPLAGAARSIATQLAPDIPAPVMTTMDTVLDDSISSERVMALLSVFFAACALLVTGMGLYGTLAYATARRTSEIGIRMALGARRAQVVRMVFRENSLVAVVGSAELIAAMLASRALASFLYSTSARDPWVMVAAVATVVAIASAASLIPALRAARIEPMSAIRHE